MTSFSTIYRIFLSQIQDYRIQQLFNSNVELAEDRLESFLFRAVPHFKNCIKPLMASYNVEAQSFDVDLDMEEISILAELMVLMWMDWNTQNILQMNVHLDDNDFKHYAEANNLKEKSEYADRQREKVSQDMTDYGLRHTPFKDWAAGNYAL